MPRTQKFRKGAQVEDWQQLSDLLRRDRWIYWLDRPKHPGWLRSMTFQTLDNAIYGGILWAAEPSEQYICNQAGFCGDKHAAAGCTAYQPHEFIGGQCDSMHTCLYSGYTRWCVPVSLFRKWEEPCSPTA
jgi:hypothetical protein